MRRVRYDLAWRRPHVAGMLAVWIIAAVAMAGRWADRPIRFGRDLPVMPERVAAVTETINPNTAPLGSLLRLGGLGPVRAAAIADYAAAHGPIAFARCEDLTAVRGIGAGIVERIRPYLTFDGAGN